ncbi:hypothetical protein [Komagataeibacter nataicola]|uniref:hypothetical protein n=1 Tax=Komagataeibacter nataicola TaxID=265960 RepID=UPI0038D0B03A
MARLFPHLPLGGVLLGLVAAGPAMAQGLDMSHGQQINVTAAGGFDWDQNAQTVTAYDRAQAIRGDVTVRGDKLVAFYRKKAATTPAPGQAAPGANAPATPGASAANRPPGPDAPLAAHLGVAPRPRHAGPISLMTRPLAPPARPHRPARRPPRPPPPTRTWIRTSPPHPTCCRRTCPFPTGPTPSARPATVPPPGLRAQPRGRRRAVMRQVAALRAMVAGRARSTALRPSGMCTPSTSLTRPGATMPCMTSIRPFWS